jgi:hypothetical protein
MKFWKFISQNQGLENPTERIIIDASLCNRVADEGKRLKLLRDHKVGDAQIHECENSEFLQWFLKENLGVYDNYNLRHLLIADDNYVIDVLAAHLPKLVSLEES